MPDHVIDLAAEDWGKPHWLSRRRPGGGVGNAAADQPRDAQGRFAHGTVEHVKDTLATFAKHAGKEVHELTPAQASLSLRTAGYPHMSPTMAAEFLPKPPPSGDVKSALLKLRGRDNYTALTDLHDALGNPPLPEFHATLQSLRRLGAIGLHEGEGRGGVSAKEYATAVKEPSSRSGGLPARLTHASIQDEGKLRELTGNIFCPTGKGGGVDATCSPGGAAAHAHVPPGFTGMTADGSFYHAGARVSEAHYRSARGLPSEHPGTAKGSAVSIAFVKQRAFDGTPTPLATPLTKLETGRLGEAIALAYLKATGRGDAHPMNSEDPNFPVDMLEDSAPTEVKAGLVSNTPRAQQWRLTFSQESKEEQAWYKDASPEERTAWNAAKRDSIRERKEAVLRQVEADTGLTVSPRTITTIINPDTRTADVYEFEGFRDRIAWESPEARRAYRRTVRYDHA